MEEMSIDQILKEMTRLQEMLISRARFQAITENMYNELVKVAKEGIIFVSLVQVGDVIQPEWIAERDRLVARARQYILDEMSEEDQIGNADG